MGDRGDVRVGAGQVRLARRHRQVAAERQRLGVPGDQRVAAARPAAAPVAAVKPSAAAVTSARSARSASRGERGDLGVGAEAGADLGELAGDLVGLDAAWAYLVRDWRSRSAAALSHSRCSSVALLQADALEGELLAGRVAQQQPLHDRLDHVVAAVGYRHGDAGALADLLVLAEQHVQDDAVDAVVVAVDA